MTGLILVIIVSLFNVFLGVLVLLSTKSLNRTKIFFSVLLLLISAWSLITFFEDEYNAQAIVRILVNFDFGLASLIGTFFFLFCKNYPTPNVFSKDQKLAIIIGSSFFFLSFTPLVIENIDITLSGTKFITGVLFYPFVLFFIFFLIFGIYQIVRTYKNSHGIQRSQTKYVLLGITVSGLVAVITNIVLPRIVPVEPIVTRVGIYGLLFFNLSTTYSIIVFWTLGSSSLAPSFMFLSFLSFPFFLPLASS